MSQAKQPIKQHFLVKIWIRLRSLLALVIVMAGLVVGLLSFLLPFESLYKERLERFLERQWGLEVNINEINGSWKGYGPYFSLKNLELTGKQSIQLASANLFINVYQLMIPGGRTGIDLSINHVELDMVHTIDGPNITIKDDKYEARVSDMMDRILNTGSLRVDEMRFNVTDQSGAAILSGLKANLLLEQDEKHRALQIQIDSGEKELSDHKESNIVIKGKGLKSQSLASDAQWYLKFEEFDLSELKNIVGDFTLPMGQLDGEIWLTVDSRSIQAITGQLSFINPMQGFRFEVLVEQHFNDSNQIVGLNHKDWQALLKFKNIQRKGQSLEDFEVLMQRKQDVSEVKTSAISVDVLIEMMSIMNLKQGFDFDKIKEISGHVDHLEISYDHRGNELQSGYSSFSALTVDHDQYSLKNLAGIFEFNSLKGELLLDSSHGALSIPKNYRGTLNWDQLDAQATIDWQGAVPKIQVNNLWCACQDFNLQVWSDLQLKENINMILNGRVSEVKVANLYKYWPHDVWKEKTLKWLDEGLLGGVVKTGFIFLSGELVPKGFKTGKADFISRAYTRGVDNRFHPEWPVVNDIEAIAVFDHDSVHVELQQASSLGLSINQAQVDIDSFDSGVINVEMQASSKNNEILDYIRNSPLVKNIELDENIKIGGAQKVNLVFDVVVKAPIKQAFDPQGSVVFSEGQFFTEHFTIDAINGPVQLDGYQLLMQDLPAQIKGAQVLLNGQIVTKSDQGTVVDVDLSGSLKTDYLLDLIQQDLPISGESNWKINIKNLRKGLIMTAKSALSGVAIDLPAPLNKLAEENKTLEVKCSIPCSDTMVEINYNDEIKSTFNTEAGQYHLTKLQFIKAMQDEQGGVDPDQLFGGYIKSLNLDQWLKLLSAQNNTEPVLNDQRTDISDKKEWPVNEIELNVQQMIFMSRAFENIKLNIKRMANSYRIEVDSEAIKGHVLVDDNLLQKGIVAEFEHLNWINPIEELIETSQAAQDAANAKIPDIHLWAKQFSYAGVPLGSIRMEMRNVADGINVEQLSLKSELAEINVSGAWNKSISGVGQSTFNIVMFSERIADFLQTVGFNAPITNAQTLIEMQARWDGVPSQFNMATIDGDLEIKIGQGEVLDQNPGFGRVLGLFNLTNLPRRLILDFRDVLADGLLFSSMEGRFKIKTGVAKTEDFLIKASSVKIHINGDVGFADQSYDQTITIRPQIGKTFPTIGAIAGGPVGAAAGFLVQGLLDKQLKNSNEILDFKKPCNKNIKTLIKKTWQK